MAQAIKISHDTGLGYRLKQLNWGLVFLITLVACAGFTALYAAAGGDFYPWASKQIFRFAVGMTGMIIIALIDIRVWQRLAYLAYAGALGLLIIVELMGHIGMGAQRWIDLGFMVLQPSEVMKVALILALARYFHSIGLEDAKRLRFVMPALVMIALPFFLIFLQPDLGTALMLAMAGASVVFLGGGPLWLFVGGIAATIAAVPIGWHFLHDYQKQRVMTFLNPESDPLGAGYHIIQSKIALGSGGIKGKGFLKGTQSNLNFLPEKQTDFIFTLWAEEWGLFGGLALLMLFGAIFLYCGWIGFRTRHVFGRLLVFGLLVNFSLYVFINIAMVMGLIPVVGAPLPLISYGGTVMLTTLCGFGLIICCNIFRDTKLPRI